ncbi:MAG: hypothetical protein M3Y17_08930 [Actinomycetota bacterium]|nr:hypothetical protein [Actinomycetota bacterium]
MLALALTGASSVGPNVANARTHASPNAAATAGTCLLPALESRSTKYGIRT